MNVSGWDLLDRLLEDPRPTPTTMAHLPPYLTVAEVAEELRISEFTVLGMVDRGELPALRVGVRTQYRIPREAYETWKQEQITI